MLFNSAGDGYVSHLFNTQQGGLDDIHWRYLPPGPGHASDGVVAISSLLF